MKLTSKFIFLILFLCLLSCNKNGVEDSNLYYGNNNYYIPALIIDTDKVLNNPEIEKLIKGYYSDDKKIEGKIKTILNYNHKPYKIVYSEREQLTGNIDINILNFDKIRKEFHQKITAFKSIQNTTSLKDQTIYGYYFNLGSCAHISYMDELSLISKDKKGTYFLTSLYKNQVSRTDTLLKKENNFEKNYLVWHGINEPQTKSKQILYETKDKDIIVKDLDYVSENEEKYVHYYFKLDK
ncbi:hypothetical protein [Flavobacterium piscis]|uniref:Lipoprotein n=1 Tax=Flavobacterium piscis TaxID=1114874 RepID=A0ABU1Y2Z9_9FLAO|nr:hypothetical protein [Flavobacterium piscis]MDR7208590.1 hypothetical protein [Flavobacterium piscis]